MLPALHEEGFLEAANVIRCKIDGYQDESLADLRPRPKHDGHVWDAASQS